MKTVVSENFLRVALIAFNFIFSILSVSLIALGVIYSEQLSYVESYIARDFLTFPTVLLILGCLSFVMSIAGCYCARSSNRRVFITFILVLTCLLVLELSVSVIAFINIDHSMENKTKIVMTDQVTSRSFAEKEEFHKVEELLSCCGVDGPEDYLKNNWQGPITKYCCGVTDCSTELASNNYSSLWGKPGCAAVVAKETQQVAKEAAAVSTVYAILQVLEIGCAYLMQGFSKT